MAVLPGYDTLPTLFGFSESQVMWLAVTQYLAILTFTGLIMMAVLNIWKFIVG